MSNKINSLYKFGEFTVDTKERILFRKDEAIILAPKVFDTLEILVKHNGNIISKNDLMDKIWEDSFVEEGNLTQNIYILRQTLGKEFIKTIPRRGYRFTADVKTESYEKTNQSEEIFKKGSSENVETPQVNPSKEIKPTKTFAIFAFGTLAVLLLGTGAFWAWNKTPSQINNVSFENVKIENLTDTGKVNSVAISPNAEFLAYTAFNDKNESILHLKDLKLNQDVELDIPENLDPKGMKFSPNGNHIYFLHRSGLNQPAEIYKITRFGGEAKIVAKDIASEFSLSKDGNQIAFVRRNSDNNNHSLIIKNLENKKEDVIIEKTFPEGFSLISSPSWTKDGKHLFAVLRKQKTFTTSLIKVNIETSAETVIKTPKWMKHIYQIEPTPSDDELIIASRRQGTLAQIYKLFVSEGNARRITNDLNNYRKISVSEDGKNIVAWQIVSSSNLWLLPDGKIESARQLTFGSFGRHGRHGLEILPNGKILYVSLEAKNRDLWTFDLSSNSKTVLTKDSGDINQNPSVSSTHIYYVALNKNIRQIKRMDLDGQNQTQIISDKNSNATFPVISPNEKTLYFIRQTKETNAIWKKSLPDGEEEQINLPKEIIPNGKLLISPNGKLLAFKYKNKSELKNQSLEKGIQIGIIPINDEQTKSTYVNLPTQNPFIRWTQTSKSIEFVKNTPDGSKIKRKGIFDESPVETIAAIPNMQVFSFLWLPNNKDLIISDLTSHNEAILLTNFD